MRSEEKGLADTGWPTHERVDLKTKYVPRISAQICMLDQTR
jgi:hypothetical protein